MQGSCRPFVLALDTPDSGIRDAARLHARDALRHLLAPLLNCQPKDVPLDCTPGRAPRLMMVAPCIGLGISHEAGLSLVAALQGGRVGIDLMRIEALPDWEGIGRDYLGPQACARLLRLRTHERPAAFAAAWTRLEAVLKCHGRPLAEWSDSHADLLSTTRALPLELPAGYAGHAAWLMDDGFRPWAERR